MVIYGLSSTEIQSITQILRSLAETLYKALEFRPMTLHDCFKIIV